ncbi:Gfo/Idh/MocA family protein [Haloferula sp.]|uniref:Gfo/Idh/MocA family protein n=1 Tax=Haloferula sp. TaxID=2497595 RepID=UPI003C7589ED
MEASNHPLRWGILGTAGIAAKNWKAIRLTGNAVVTAVASRDLERCRRFIDEQQAVSPFADPPEALGSYEALIARRDVDAIYIPLPTALRKAWVIRAAEAGKHVICEKPCAINAAELKEMLKVCRDCDVQFMDGVMFMHNERMDRIRAVLNDAEQIGSVRRIQSAFSFFGGKEFQQENIRVQSELEPLGCLGDLGWYCIRYALWVMKWQLPVRVVGRILSEAASVSGQPGSPLEFSGELFFEGGVSSGFYCSFGVDGQQWVVVNGEQGTLRCSDFVIPTSQIDTAYEVGHQRVPKEGSGMELGTETNPGSQETHMFRSFSDEVLNGRRREDWPSIAWRTQLVTDACLASARAESRPLAVSPERSVGILPTGCG